MVVYSTIDTCVLPSVLWEFTVVKTGEYTESDVVPMSLQTVEAEEKYQAGEPVDYTVIHSDAY